MEKEVEVKGGEASTNCLVDAEEISIQDAESVLATVLEEYALPDIIRDVRSKYGSGEVCDKALSVIANAMTTFLTDRGKEIFHTQWKQAMKLVSTGVVLLN